MLRSFWWKIPAVLLLAYTCTYGFLVEIPSLDGRLQQSIRNLFFHVPMWFSMMVLLFVSVVYSIKYLVTSFAEQDVYARQFAAGGTLLGVLGLVTGAIWANYQWGSPWSGDPKQNGSAIALLIYLAYFVLRGSMPEGEKRNRISAVYNIFAFAMLFPAIWILPRLTESLHPGGEGGAGGNPALNGRDLAPSMKVVFWPAVLGWTLLATWITTLYVRLDLLAEKRFMIRLTPSRKISAILMVLISTSAMAQPASADPMEQHGKIYVVMAVVLTILTGLIIYLIRLDRKISNLEKQDAQTGKH